MNTNMHAAQRESFPGWSVFPVTPSSPASPQEWAERLRNQTNCSRAGVVELSGSRGALPASGGVFHTAVTEESSHLVCDADQTTRLRNVACSPTPDAFNPCEDIMGYKTLRWAPGSSRAASRLIATACVGALTSISGAIRSRCLSDE